jgi:hydrogenase maturation protease
MSAPAEVLVIGIGNPLRGDDGVGTRVAERVAEWEIPGVTVEIVHQILPELAEAVAESEVAIFVDACVDTRSVHMREIRPGGLPWSAHRLTPSELMALIEAVYGRVPDAWELAIPVASLETGEALSETAEKGVEEAAGWLSRCLHSRRLQSSNGWPGGRSLTC